MKLFIKTETNLLNPHYVIVAVNNIPGDRTGPQVVHTHEGGANGDPTPETKYLMSKNFLFFFHPQKLPKEKRQKTGFHEGEQKLWVHLGPGASNGSVELEEMIEETIRRILCKLHVKRKRRRVGRLKPIKNN